MGFISVFLLIYYHSHFFIDGRYIHNETFDSLALLEGYFGDYEFYMYEWEKRVGCVCLGGVTCVSEQ